MKNTIQIRLQKTICLLLLLVVNIVQAQITTIVPPSVGGTQNKENSTYIDNSWSYSSSFLFPQENQNSTNSKATVEPINQTVWDGSNWSNGYPDTSTIAILNANFSSSETIEVTDIQIKDGATLTLEDGGLLKTKQPLTTATRKNIIMNEGSGLMSRLPNSPLSSFIRDNGKVNKFSNMFMSSPVSGQVIGDTYNFLNPTYDTAYRQYDYNYTYIPDTQQMLVGRGYIESVNGTEPYDNRTLVPGYNHTYVGTENTGNYTMSIVSGFNLLGNPYATALDADSFLLDPSNTSVSTIYLWTRNTLASSLVSGSASFNFSSLDYALYNVLGGVNAGKNITLGTNNQLVPFSERENIFVPDGKINFGTAFFIKATVGSATFKNTMTTSASSQNFRNSSNRVSPTALIPPPARSRIWINLSEGNAYSSSGKFRQALIGYVEGATNAGNDRLFDAATLSDATFNPFINIYSMALSSSVNLAIQGRSGFANTDSFQLGYKTLGGTFTFSTTHDGIFNTQQYYIFDAVDGGYHTLPYTFTTASGVFDSRFTVVFKNLVSITSPACGTQLANIWNTVYSTQIPGVTVYKFKVANADGSPFGAGIFDSPPSQLSIPYDFNLNLVGITLNTSYLVSVATYTVDGVWQFGPPCQFITPLYPSTTFLSNCAATPTIITNYNQSIYGRVITERGMTSTGYRFQVSTTSSFTAGTIVGTIQKTVNNFSLAELRPSYAPIPNTTYFIRMQIEYNGAWVVDTLGNPVYGSVCQVQTNSNPGGRLSNIANTIFEANAYPNPFATAFKLEINTSSDQIVFVKTYDMIGRLIDSKDIPATEIGTQEIGSTFPAGVYNIVVSQGDNVKTMRVIKR